MAAQRLLVYEFNLTAILTVLKPCGSWAALLGRLSRLAEKNASKNGESG
jgi:hypothetical protein